MFILTVWLYQIRIVLIMCHWGLKKYQCKIKCIVNLFCVNIYLLKTKKTKSLSSKLVIWQNDRIKQIIFSVKIVHHTTHNTLLDLKLIIIIIAKKKLISRSSELFWSDYQLVPISWRSLLFLLVFRITFCHGSYLNPECY